MRREPAPLLESGYVQVRSLSSLISTGTELMALQQNVSGARIEFSQWITTLPFYPGYATIGVVGQTNEVDELKTGAIVAVRQPHASHQVVPAAECYPVPAEVSPLDATWFALAKIAFRGIQAAQLRPGQSVVVAGSGPVGQMVTRWAAASGARDVIVVDPAASRLHIAVDGGATAVVDKPLELAREDITSILDSRPLQAVIDSTGNPVVLASALRASADSGIVVSLSDGGRPDELRLTSDLMFRGLHLVGAFDELDIDGFTERRIVDLFFHLVAAGRFPLERLITHRFAPEQCEEAYRLAQANRHDTIGVAFDWSHELEGDRREA